MAQQISIDGNNFEMVSSHELANGDVIYNNGSLMELQDRNSRAPEEGRCYGGGDVVWFKGIILGDQSNPKTFGSMPISWCDKTEEGLRYWTVQGNGNKQWARKV